MFERHKNSTETQPIKVSDLNHSKKNCSTVIAKSRHMKNSYVGMQNNNQFDPLPGGAFSNCSGSVAASQDSQRKPKRRKISELSILDSRIQQPKGAAVKKYGIGKGLMTVWRATKPDAQCLTTGVNFINREAAKIIAAVECNKDDNRKKAYKAECKLAIVELRSQEQSGALMVLMDDEELELRELQAGPNPLACSHLAIDGCHSCSLCKDLLARFPPLSVKMKQPLCTRPWDSSPEIVKKLFTVFRFLYTHSAFHDKDSLLLGKIHVALLKLLLVDVESKPSIGFIPCAAKDCRFLGFLHFIMEQGFDVKFWNRALNPLTWIEILQLVLVAAGFSAKQSSFQTETLSNVLNNFLFMDSVPQLY
ncbi:hypothetical protein MRB53_020526 [Persea americana]|uniref:Uncharacterized protein n=1 Tax=Persea americana TaxID=3435 RepID=A0ACC2L175_PERAE|nr:hypothetical protein MRB53_020526 [Persea americana]